MRSAYYNKRRIATYVVHLERFTTVTPFIVISIYGIVAYYLDV